MPHSPDPLRVVGPDNEPYGDIEIWSGRTRIARLWQDDAPVQDYNEMQWANARRIVQAWNAHNDLIAACEMLDKWVRNGFEVGSGSGTSIMIQIRAALAKARGPA